MNNENCTASNAAQTASSEVQNLRVALDTAERELATLRVAAMRTSREVESLQEAVLLLGFDPRKLTDAMSGQNDSFWPRLALVGTSVRFDRNRAQGLEPRGSPVLIAAAESWFLDVRLPAAPATGS
jgi:hypothetical protein